MGKEQVECVHWNPEVDPEVQEMKNKSKMGLIIAVSSVAAVVLVVCLFLFGPLGKWLEGTIPPDEPETLLSATEATQGFEPTTPVQAAEEDPNLANGIMAFEQKQYDAAVVSLNMALAGNPESVRAYTYRGYSFFMLEKYQEAITDFGQAIRRSPESADIIALRGGSYFKAGYYSEAISDLTRAIEMAPDNKNALSYRGKTYEAMGQHALAMADYATWEAMP